MVLPERMNPSHSHPEPPDEGSTLPVLSAILSASPLAEKRVHPHVLRHGSALTVLQATKDLRKVSLWLGLAHTQTTEMYTRVDPSVKTGSPGTGGAPEAALRTLQGHRQTDRIDKGGYSYAEQKSLRMTSVAGPVGANSA